METVLNILISIIILEHLYFMVLESFLWTKKRTRKIFGLKSLEFAEETKVLAANQGLYNAFLAVGLLLSFYKSDTFYIAMFLSFVLVAGIIGTITTKNIRLFWVQGFPALLSLCLLILVQAIL